MTKKSTSAPVDPLDAAPMEYDVTPIEGLTERERRFSVAFFEVSLAQGKDEGAAVVAYKRVFPNAIGKQSSSSPAIRSLINSPRVRQMVSRLRETYSQRVAVSAETTTEEIEKLAFSNMLDYIEVHDDGTASLNLTGISPRQAACIQELNIEDSYDKEGALTRKTKIKLYSKIDALDKMARIHGLYQDRLNLSFSLEDIDRAIAVKERKLLEMKARPVVIEHKPQGDRNHA